MGFFVSASVFTRPNTVLASTVTSHIFHHGLRLTVSAMTAYDAHVSPRRPNTAADPSFLDFPLLRLLLILLMLSAFHISAFRRHHRRRVSAQLRLSPLRRCRSISSSFWSGDLPAEDALQQMDERFHRTEHRGWITRYEEVSRSHAVRDWSECPPTLFIHLRSELTKWGEADYSRILLAKEFIQSIFKRNAITVHVWRKSVNNC